MVRDIQAVNHFLSAGHGNHSTVLTDDGYILCVRQFCGMVLDCFMIFLHSDSTVPNQPAGPFWAVLNRLLIMGQTVVLLFSEIGWPSSLFEMYFPVLGKDFGLGATGLIQSL